MGELVILADCSRAIRERQAAARQAECLLASYKCAGAYVIAAASVSWGLLLVPLWLVLR